MLGGSVGEDFDGVGCCYWLVCCGVVGGGTDGGGTAVGVIVRNF